MSVLRNTRNALNNPDSRIHWVRLVVAFAGLIGLSFVLAALLNILKSQLNINIYQYAWLAYLSVFIASLLANATIIAPVPFAIAIMASAAQYFNPRWLLWQPRSVDFRRIERILCRTVWQKDSYPRRNNQPQTYHLLGGEIRFWAIAVIAFQP